jgi:hypothetical protein
VLTLILIKVGTTLLLGLVNQTKTKILKVGSRHTIYLEKAFVEDSQFPFEPDEPLLVRIDKNRLVVEKR